MRTSCMNTIFSHTSWRNRRDCREISSILSTISALLSIFHRSNRRYTCLSDKSKREPVLLQRVKSTKTPNPLCRKFYGPKFLQRGQIIEVRSQEEAFQCSTLLHDLFIVSAKAASEKKCCKQSDLSEKDSCKANQKVSPNTSIVSQDEYQPVVGSMYLNEKALTITLNGEYVKKRMGSKGDFELHLDTVWDNLKTPISIAIENQTEPLSSNDEESYTGSIKVLDKIDEVDHTKITRQPIWNNANEDTEISCDDSEPVMAVKELIRLRVKPLLEQDGGSCRFVGMVEEGDSFHQALLQGEPKLETGSVFLLLEGACVGCPSSSFTLKNGVQRMLTHWVPEVTQVVEVDEEFTREVVSARKKLDG